MLCLKSMKCLLVIRDMDLVCLLDEYGLAVGDQRHGPGVSVR